MSKRHLKLFLFPSLILLSVFFFMISGGPLFATPEGGDAAKQTETGIVSLQSVKELKKASKDYDFVYLVLSNDAESDGALRETVLAAAKSADKDAKIGLFEISRGTNGFDKFVRKHMIKKFPAVIAMDKGGNSKTMQGEVSQEKLTDLYSEMSGAKKKLRCPMSEGKPCDPKACGKSKGK